MVAFIKYAGQYSPVYGSGYRKTSPFNKGAVSGQPYYNYNVEDGVKFYGV